MAKPPTNLPPAAPQVEPEQAPNPLLEPGADRPAVTTAQAAEVLGVSAQTVQKWVDAGHLPAWRTMGGHRRLDAQAVRHMVQERLSQQSRQQLRELPRLLSAQPSPNPQRPEHNMPPLRPSATGPVLTAVLDVVLVEDNPLTLEVLAERLRRLLPGLQVRACADAVAALLEVGRVVPDLLVADINLPGIDGLAMLAQLRHNPQTRAMQVLLVTHHSPEEVRRNFGEPPSGVPLLQKPVSDSALSAALGGVVQQKNQRVA
jgi:excisionase family DNA binding protein